MQSFTLNQLLGDTPLEKEVQKVSTVLVHRLTCVNAIALVQLLSECGHTGLCVITLSPALLLMLLQL